MSNTRTIVLHGALRQQFGSSIRVSGDNLPMLMRGVNSAFPDFIDTVRQGIYKVRANGRYIGADEVWMNLSSKVKRIDITPAVAMSNSGKGKTVIGAIIVGFALVASGGTLAAPLAGLGGTAFTFGGAAVTWGSVALLGTAIALSGISTMLAPKPTGSTVGAGAEQRASFLFNGATNVNEQGGPVPLVFGRYRVGSTRISVDVSTEQVPV